MAKKNCVKQDYSKIRALQRGIDCSISLLLVVVTWPACTRLPIDGYDHGILGRPINRPGILFLLVLNLIIHIHLATVAPVIRLTALINSQPVNFLIRIYVNQKKCFLNLVFVTAFGSPAFTKKWHHYTFDRVRGKSNTNRGKYIFCLFVCSHFLLN